MRKMTQMYNVRVKDQQTMQRKISSGSSTFELGDEVFVPSVDLPGSHHISLFVKVMEDVWALSSMSLSCIII